MALQDEFANKVALVTGGTAGIGRAAALAFADAGCRVVVIGRTEAAGAEFVDEVRSAGGEARFFAADLADAEAARETVRFTLDTYGQLDIAFNNAGHRDAATPFTELAIEEFDRVMNVNLRSVFAGMQAQIRAMLGRGGVIINNASVSGVRNALPGVAAYAASKAALISLTKSAAAEYAVRGIRINALSPGRIRTPMVRHYSDAQVQAMADVLPVKRLGEEAEAAAAVLWLASSASSFVIGHNLCVDGGFLAS